MSLAGEENVPPLLSEEGEGQEREAPPHVRDPLDPDVPVHNAADDPPADESDDEQSEDEPLVPPVSPPPLPEQPETTEQDSDPEE